MRTNKNTYEINTRVWLKRFSVNGNAVTIKDVPKEYWENLHEMGIDYVWLMGVWKTNETVISEYCFEPDLVNEYNKALKDFHDDDVIGSPYSIDSYEINPKIGTEQEILELKEHLNSLNIKLILDFVSNHFSVHSSLVESNPELFLSASEEIYKRDTHTYFRSKYDKTKLFAHGRDPFFPAWQDTIQLNFFNPETRKFMIDSVFKITKLCNGIRCDMAMLSLNNVFDNTWSGTLTFGKYEKPSKEFWDECITEVKKVNEEFLFIGEAYWDLEWELQRLGFDFTYDKKLLDRLRVGQISEIRGHLMAEKEYQNKSIRFIENHDEERAITLFGGDKAKAAAIIFSTIPGMKLYHDGQFEGKRVKLPVQLGREPNEKVNKCTHDFYKHLLRLTNSEVFRYGTWKLINSKSAWDGNKSFTNFLIWEVILNQRNRLVVVNFSREVSQCRINLNLKNYPPKFKLKDMLNNKTYYRKTEEVIKEGLFIELGPFKSHIFSY